MWLHKGKELKEVPENIYGFVYKISPINIELFGDIYYIGCKGFYNTTNPKISKKKANELYSGKGRKPTRQKKIKESDWKTYISSSKKLQGLIEENGKELFKFEILSFHNCYTSMILNESKLIIEAFLNNDNNILNDWISVKCRKLR